MMPAGGFPNPQMIMMMQQQQQMQQMQQQQQQQQQQQGVLQPEVMPTAMGGAPASRPGAMKAMGPGSTARPQQQQQAQPQSAAKGNDPFADLFK
jgi:hypothetical protein